MQMSGQPDYRSVRRAINMWCCSFYMIWSLFFCGSCLHKLLWLTSCGGTSNVTVLKSTTLTVSRQGRIKKRPGPLALPDVRRPRRRITALSYSFTIYILCSQYIGKLYYYIATVSMLMWSIRLLITIDLPWWRPAARTERKWWWQWVK